MRRYTASLCLLSAFVVSPLLAGHAQLSTTPRFIAVDPRSSFYRASSNDGPVNPTFIFLGGLAPGTVIHITPSGAFQAAGGPTSPPLFSGLFSSTNALLSDLSLLNRVPGAIDAGAPYYQSLIHTGPTFYQGLPTDIPEDFTIPNGLLGNGLSIAIPDGAQWLFVDMMDDYYADNTTPDRSDFGVSAFVESTVTPEPCSVLLLATGLVAMTLIAPGRSARSLATRS